MDVHHYWLFAPSRGGFIDDPGSPPAFEHSVSWQGKKYQWAVFTDSAGHPLAARLLIEGAPDERMTADAAPLATMLIQHTLAILRTAWGADVTLLPMTFSAQKQKEGAAGLNIEWPAPSPLDVNLARALFEHALPMREFFRLFTDGVNESIPLQFRFLSLYKIIELQFRDGDGHWDNGGLARALAFQQAEFSALALPRPFPQELHNMRDRCAHIRVGRGKKRRLGVTSLSHDAAIEVERLFPLLRAICANLLNEKADGKFVMQTQPPTWTSASA